MSDKKNFFMRHKIITGILVLIILGGVGSAIGSKKDHPTKVGETASTQSQPTSSEAKKDDAKKNETKKFKVGDVVQLKDFKISVNKVFSVEGNEVAKPKDGNQFLAIDCTIENASAKEQTVSSMMMFKVVDQDGRECEYSLMGQTAANAGQLDGTVGAGRKITGVYVVEVPKGKTGLELEFDASLLSSGQVVVSLN